MGTIEIPVKVEAPLGRTFGYFPEVPLDTRYHLYRSDDTERPRSPIPATSVGEL
jgi:hypothetical protein